MAEIQFIHRHLCLPKLKGGEKKDTHTHTHTHSTGIYIYIYESKQTATRIETHRCKGMHAVGPVSHDLAASDRGAEPALPPAGGFFSRLLKKFCRTSVFWGPALPSWTVRCEQRAIRLAYKRKSFFFSSINEQNEILF